MKQASLLRKMHHGEHHLRAPCLIAYLDDLRLKEEEENTFGKNPIFSLVFRKQILFSVDVD